MPNSSSERSVVERLVINRIGHLGDGIADGADGAIYVPGALPGETVEVEEVAGHPDRRRLLHVDAASPERITPICPHFGVCGGCAVQHWEMARYRDVEARSCHYGFAPSGPRRTGLRSDRRARRRPPPCGISRPPRHARCARGRVLGRSRAPSGRNRPLSGFGQKPGRGAEGRLGNRRNARSNQKTARHSRHVDGCRPRYRCPRLGRADCAARLRRWRLSAPSTIWRGSRATANSSRRRACQRCGLAKQSCNCRRPPSCRPQRMARPRWRGSFSARARVATRVADLFSGIGPFALRRCRGSTRVRGRR